MRNLVLLFVRFGGFFLFILLEVVSFYLIVRYNQDQKSIYIASVKNVSGTLNEAYEDIAGFWHLKDVADSLAMENARLRQQLAYSKYNNTIRLDSGYNALQQYHYQQAEIVQKTTHRNNNIFTINRGKRHGVQPHMGVIAPNGIVGVVTSVTESFAEVLPVLHRQSRVSAAIRRTGYSGSLVWRGNDPTTLTLENIPKHANLEVGDTVQTSGYSAMFPAEIMIGKISKYWLEPGSNYFNVQVRLSNDLPKEKYVYVVNNILRRELEEKELVEYE